MTGRVELVVSRSSHLPLIVAGTAIIAVCYGLARYAYGLFVPQIADTLGLSSTTVGVVGGLSHVGYGLGLLVAPALCRRRPLAVARGAGLIAAAGLAGTAASGGPLALGTAVTIGGLSSGLASPALAQLVTDRLAPRGQATAQTWINSGTSTGLALSAPAILLPGSWRVAWSGFAVAATATACLAAVVLRGPSAGTVATRGHDGRRGGRDLRLLAACTVLGGTSAAYWTFSVQRVQEAGLASGWTTGFWVAIGLVGLLGGRAGAHANRVGLPRAVRTWSALWAAALATLAFPVLPAPVALASAAGFGAAYMALTGLAIIWSVARATDAASAVRTCFLALGVGQAVATPLVGGLADLAGSTAPTFAVSAAASLVLLHGRLLPDVELHPARSPCRC